MATLSKTTDATYDRVLSHAILANIAARSGELTGSDLQSRLSQHSTVQVARVINNLIQSNQIRVTSVGTLAINNKLNNQAEVSSTTTAYKELTLQLPAGAIADLKRYAREQGTTVELEAAHLLREIIRLYKAQSVIPTN